jgi:hypothetical protein
MMVLKKAGALRNGREFSARNPVWHAVETSSVYSCTPALCGAMPSIQWADSTRDQEVTCARCLKKLAPRCGRLETEAERAA